MQAMTLNRKRPQAPYHMRPMNYVVWPIALFFLVFVVGANYLQIDQVSTGMAEVITKSRVQVIQSVDGGVISEIMVREGDTVESGQVLARLDDTKLTAAVEETRVRYFALQAKAVRLRAEVTNAEEPAFSEEVATFYPDIFEVERALFNQRKVGLAEELRTLSVAQEIAKEQLENIERLRKSGDVSREEILKARESLNTKEASYINRKNEFLQRTQEELSKVEDELAQTEQILNRRMQELRDSVFRAKVDGTVKNIRVTTVGGVLGPGEELMQIVPSGDDLIIEAKIKPQDIAQIHQGLPAEIRLDPYDYTIYGGVPGHVSYVSPDTLKEDSAQGEEIYYRVHVVPDSNPVVTNIGAEVGVISGMTASVSIETGERSLLDFLLKPIRKTITQSFGER